MFPAIQQSRPVWAVAPHAPHAPVVHKGRVLMPLINVVITLIVVGVLLWLVNSYIPMDGKIKRILNVVVVIAVVLWLLSAFGLIGNLGNVRVGR
jgi:hypothetical protein